MKESSKPATYRELVGEEAQKVSLDVVPLLYVWNVGVGGQPLENWTVRFS